ncbi:MAG: hypothetical protein P9M06_00040, partial [Candidatus Saelkia tenebricola]|nr:hypothetical protein [Candidatus Saelkia tenebricola]
MNIMQHYPVLNKTAIFFISIYLLLSMTTSLSAQTIQEDILYINDTFGIKATVPNWPIIMQRLSRLVIFQNPETIEKSKSAETFSIIINESANFPGTNSAFQYAESVANDMKTRLKNTLEIIKPVKEIKIGDYNAATITYKVLTKNKETNNEFYIVTTYYLGDNTLSLMYSAEEEVFNKSIQNMTKYLTSFEKLPPEDTIIELEKFSKKHLKFNSIDNTKYTEIKEAILENMPNIKTYKSCLVIKDRANESLKELDYYDGEIQMTYVDDKNFEITTIAGNGATDVWRVAEDNLYIKLGIWMPMNENSMESVSPSGNENQFNKLIQGKKNIYKGIRYQIYGELLENETPVGLSNDISDFTALKFINPQKLYLNLGLQNTPKKPSSQELILYIHKKDNTLRFVQTNLEGKINTELIKTEFLQTFTNFNQQYNLGKPFMIKFASQLKTEEKDIIAKEPQIITQDNTQESVVTDEPIQAELKAVTQSNPQEPVVQAEPEAVMQPNPQEPVVQAEPEVTMQPNPQEPVVQAEPEVTMQP